MATDPGTDKTRPILGLPGKDKPQTSADGANPGSMASAEAKAEAQAGLEARKRGPYVKSGKYSTKNREVGSGERPTTPSGTAVPAEVQAELDRLFSPEIWEPLVEMPSAIGMVLTGHEHWALSEKEKRVGSVSVSTAAKYAGIQSPAKLAFLLAALNLSGIYMPKILAEIKIRAAEKMKAQKKPPENVGS